MAPKATYRHTYRTGDGNTVTLIVDPHPGPDLANELGRLATSDTSELLPAIISVARANGYEAMIDPGSLSWDDTAGGGSEISVTLTTRPTGSR